jgi:excinuclease ABC subunit A
MSQADIVIRGAREHNLRNVDLRLPRNKLICMTGVSGSGKSSLAFDTLYAEGQRRYVESLSSYARQFLGQMPKPEVDSVSGLAPSISIQQKTSGRNPRSTVGTITEVYDYLRVLFARVGKGYCPECDRPIAAQTSDQIIDSIAALEPDTRFSVLAPVVQQQKGEYRDLFEDLLKQGYLRARVNGEVVQLSDDLSLDRHMKHTIEVVIDRLVAGKASRARLAEAVESALRVGGGRLIVAQEGLGSRVEGLGTEESVAAGDSSSAPTTLAGSRGSENGDVTPKATPAPAAKSTRRKTKSAKPEADNDSDSVPRPSTLDPRPSTTDRLYSAHYACTHCQISYEPPSPQLFSFNSPLGMCLDCTGLGMRHDFILSRLIPDDSLSFVKGAIDLVGSWKELGRWKKHLFEGVAAVLEREHDIEEGTFLKTPWRDLPAPARKQFLYGLGNRNITFTWKHRGGLWKHGGTWPGIVPELLESYRKASNPMRRRQLEKYMEETVCASCGGSRLNRQAAHVKLATTSDQYRQLRHRSANGTLPASDEPTAKKVARSLRDRKPNGSSDSPTTEQHPQHNSDALMSLGLPAVCGLSIAEAHAFFESLALEPTQQFIAEEVLKEIRGRLGFLLKCGLDYLTLDRTAPTLSGGESQRIRLASQIGCGLVGVVYILDEPSIGLHPRDNTMLLESLCSLRDQGNTVIVVEHDEETMRAADHIVDFGPGPGVRGGEVVAEGTLDEIRENPRSLTAQYLSGKVRIEVPKRRRVDGRLLMVDGQSTEASGSEDAPAAPTKRGRKANPPAPSASAVARATKPTNPASDHQPSTINHQPSITLRGARHNNLRNVDVAFPLGALICVTGVSGSGKSSLVNDILWEILNRDINEGIGHPGAFDAVEGLENIDKAIDIDQSPIGRTPRSNPATYTKLFDLIRDFFTQLPESRVRGYKPGRFSFNVEGGRCEACEGHGANKLEMDFLADVWVTCPVCEGRRFSRETLEVHYKGKSITDVLNMDVQEALVHFADHPQISRILQTLHDVGLDYIKLGQPSPTLSGGEAQRIKLARELGKRSTGRTIYLLDEPTTGLHFADVHKLLDVLHSFADQGNTVLVVEHNLDVIKTADWVIDLGPEGGSGGGTIVAVGTPEEVARCEASHTGRALKAVLAESAAPPANPKPDAGKRPRPAAAAVQPSPATADITVRGASQHNLQHLNLTIPREQMSVFCGPSGSGKTSLAMDTLYAEGQRRYVESLTAYARQFLGQMPKPKVEHVHGLSPAIAIEQKTVGNTPRSTVGTVTEIYDYLRILWTRLGTLHCPECEIPVETQTTDQVIDKLQSLPKGTKLLLLAPQEVEVGQKYDVLWSRLKEAGFVRVRINGTTYRLEDVPAMDRKRKHQVEVVVDRVTIGDKRSRLAQSVESGLDLGRGMLHAAHVEEDRPETEWQVDRFSLHFACQKCGRSFETLTPHNFSFNSPLGWCSSCEGLGVAQGTNLAALLDTKRTLNEGAIAAWPKPSESPMFAAMLKAMSVELRLPLDVPYARLDPQQQQQILYGTGDRWYEAMVDAASGKGRPSTFRFQYKGLYPALEEASRVSFAYRMALQDLIGEVACPACRGSRLRDDAAAVRFEGRTLGELCALPLGEALDWLKAIKLKTEGKKVGGDLLREATNRLSFLAEVGLHYLTLARTLPTLSGGEMQRIRLAGQIGRALTGVLYILDEPTIGLHPRDNGRLLEALKKLRDLGNTLILVEHDREVIEAADRVYDFGPGSGRLGGTVTGEGSPRQLERVKTSLTGDYLSGRRSIPVPLKRRIELNGAAPAADIAGGENPTAPATPLAGSQSSKKRSIANPPAKSVARTKRPLPAAADDQPSAIHHQPPSSTRWLELLGCRHNNLRDVDLRIPLGTFTCITGVSGSGKSSLIEDTLAKAVARKLHRANETPAPHDELRGLQHIDKAITVDQQPLGSTPASNPATYTGVFELMRELFTRLPEAKVRGFRPARFSFNRPGGRCEDCEGNGQKRIEMHFLPDVWVECETCRGKRYNHETLAVTYKGKSIADVLDMPIGEALELFNNVPKIRSVLATLSAIGLDYLTLGQPAPTLSGGEAQRVKLAAELSRPDTGRTLYILDEPTTGLHFDDIAKLLKVLNSLVEKGNTVVVIEHNLDVIKTADWIIDLGPEAGIDGGWIIAEGTPEDVVARHSGASTSNGEAATTSKKVARSLRDRKPNGSSDSPTSNNSPQPKSGNVSRSDTATFRSWTAELLAPILAAEPRAERDVFRVEEVSKKRKGDVDIAQIGREQKMPWQSDGRRWHLVQHLSLKGAACRWEAGALELVADLLDGDQRVGALNWNSQSIVEATVTGADNWFLHALTGDEWLLTLKFRCRRNTFKEETLAEKLGLKQIDDLDELPIYGRVDRVRVKNLGGAWQEVTITVHWKKEVDTAAFRDFVEKAMASYATLTGPAGNQRKLFRASELESVD